MIPQQTIDLILDTARIDEVVSDFVALKRRGASFVACCPFHNEKTPSFYVTPSKGIYKCFGCQKAGNAVGFVMEHERCSYVEALRYLANKYHITITEEEETAEQIANRQRSESLMLVMEFAQKFFCSQLAQPEGKALAYAYYRSRGIDDATISAFGLGWAPSSRTALHDAAVAAGYKEEYLIEAGLCTRYDDGRVMDSFIERVTFPIHSLQGRPIAYSCRTLKSDPHIAKYKNSSDTPLYDKSRSLYGIYLAKAEIARLDKCYLVEGNVDVVTMSQTGIKNVVASCGTALTQQQIRLIKKFTNNVVVMYDGDGAGVHAALRAIPMILSEGMTVSLVLFPDGDDPDSYCRKHSLEEVQSFLSSAEQDFVSYMATTGADRMGDPIKRSTLINEVADAIASMPDPIARTVYVETCVRLFGTKEEALFQRIHSKRNSIREEEMKEKEREQRRRENLPDIPPPPEFEPKYQEETLPEPQIQIENRILEPAEKDILYFLLNHGTKELDFSSDSPYYCGEQSKPTVADFIRSAIESDGSHLSNSVYRRCYDMFFALYDEKLQEDQIITRLLSSQDRTVAGVVSQLGIEKYNLTVQRFKNALTTTSSWLTIYVPKTIVYYAERRIQDQMDQCKQKLKTQSPEEQMQTMKLIIKLQAAQKKVQQKLGRENNR